MTSSTSGRGTPASRQLLTRRSLIASTGLVAAAVSAAPLLGRGTFIGGHLTRLGTRDDVVIQQEYVADLKAQAASAIDTFNVAGVYKSVDPANPWAIFRGYLDGVAAQAANAVVPAGSAGSAGPTSTPWPTPTNSLSRCGSTTATSARSGSIPSYPGLQPTCTGQLPAQPDRLRIESR
jgi:hypothetical protein